MATTKIIPGGVAKVTIDKPEGDYGPGGHKASGRTQSMFSLFARGDSRKVVGSRDNASLMAYLNPKALAEFTSNDNKRYLTPNGSGFSIGDVPLIHPKSDLPQDQPLGLLVWDLTWNTPHEEWRPIWGPRDSPVQERWYTAPELGEVFVAWRSKD